MLHQSSANVVWSEQAKPGGLSLFSGMSRVMSYPDKRLYIEIFVHFFRILTTVVDPII